MVDMHVININDLRDMESQTKRRERLDMRIVFGAEKTLKTWRVAAIDCTAWAGEKDDKTPTRVMSRE